jgi:hypothetical protein
MTLGPDLVLACPHCAAPVRLFTLADGSPEGAVSWTDGYQEAPNAPRQPNITRCHACGKLHWTVEARELGMMEPQADLEHPQGRFAEAAATEPSPEGATAPESWLRAPQMRPLDEAGYFEALREGLAQSPEQEMELRVHAWWRGNDAHRRCDQPGRYPTSAEAVENAEKLIALTQEGDHELVLFRAEALRQLGRFEEARTSLYGLCSDYAFAREKLADLIKAGSRDLDILFS